MSKPCLNQAKPALNISCCCVLQGMDELLVELHADEDREVGARLGKAVSKWLPALGINNGNGSS
jgi:hypothetical protein